MIFVSEFESDVAIVFVDIAVIMLAARVMGALFQRIRQPAVVGEIVAGMLLGPSLLGAFPGDLHDRLFPAGEVRQYLGVLAQLGLVIFMFIVGMESTLRLIEGKARIAGFISVCSVALPFGLGLALASMLHSRHHGPDMWPLLDVRALPGRVHVRDRVPRAGSDPRRAGDVPDLPGRARARLCRGGRRPRCRARCSPSSWRRSSPAARAISSRSSACPSCSWW